MKRNSLSYLIETELEKAEVILAAKGIANKLQQMAEQLAKMDANDVMPLGDAMREIFGAEQASSFEQHVSDTLRGLTEQVRDAKNSISDQLDALDKGQPMTDVATKSSDDLFGGDAGAAPSPHDEAATDDHAEGQDMFAPQGGEEGQDQGHDDLDMKDLFSGAPEQSNAAGRPQKESVAPRKRVIENSRLASRPLKHVSADHRLTGEFAGLIREGKSVAQALQIVAESYAIDTTTVAEIVTAIKASKKR